MSAIIIGNSPMARLMVLELDRCGREWTQVLAPGEPIGAGDPFIFPFFSYDSVEILMRFLPDILVTAINFHAPTALFEYAFAGAATTEHGSTIQIFSVSTKDCQWDPSLLIRRSNPNMPSLKTGLISQLTKSGVHFSDGSTLEYQEAFWVGESKRLRAVGGDAHDVLLGPDRAENSPYGAIQIIFGEKTPRMILSQIESFNFRFKDLRSTALRYRYTVNDSKRDNPESCNIYLCNFPFPETGEREDQAKFVRSFRREIGIHRDRSEGMIREKIVYHPCSPILSTPSIVTNKLLPNLYLCGTDQTLDGIPKEARHFEIALHHAKSALISAGIW